MTNIEPLQNTPDIDIIDTDIETLTKRIIETYEDEYYRQTGEKINLMPADDNRILLQTAAYLVMLGLISADYEFKQGSLKYAQGPALDNIGATRCSVERPKAKYAIVPIKYTFDSALTSSQIIPKGNRVSVGDVYFQTTENAIAEVGATDITLILTCTEAGEIGNDFEVGTITTHTDPLPFVKSVENTEISQGGITPTDDDYTELIYNTPESYAVAGPTEAYIAKCKEYSELIEDVAVITPDDEISFSYKFDTEQTVDSSTTEENSDVETEGTEETTSTTQTVEIEETKSVNLKDGSLEIENSNIETASINLSETTVNLTFAKPVKSFKIKMTRGGIVNIYPLLKNAEKPTQVFLQGLLNYLSEEKNRPLTDKVQTFEPEEQNYNIEFEYYISAKNSLNEESIKTAVEKAVEEYINYQQSGFGIDINPDELTKLVKLAGAKRLVIKSPTYTALKQNQVAKLSTKSVTYKGLE